MFCVDFFDLSERTVSSFLVTSTHILPRKCDTTPSMAKSQFLWYPMTCVRRSLGFPLNNQSCSIFFRLLWSVDRSYRMYFSKSAQESTFRNTNYSKHSRYRAQFSLVSNKMNKCSFDLSRRWLGIHTASSLFVPRSRLSRILGSFTGVMCEGESYHCDGGWND